MYDMFKWQNKYVFFQGKWKFSLFDMSCWMHITKIFLSHTYKNTVMSDEPIVRLQSSLQFIATRMPVIMLEKVED